MNAMNLSATTKDDFIEFVAATYFRVQATLQALYALLSLVTTFGLFVEDRQFQPPVDSSHSLTVTRSLHNALLTSVSLCIENVVMCVLLFFLAVPLARLVRRSLSHAWESTTTKVASKAGLVEPLMAVLFRAMAVSLILEAFCGTLRSSVSTFFWSFMPSHTGAGPSWQELSTIEALTNLAPFLINILIPIALFVLSLYFARTLSTGLSRALSSNPVNLVNPV
jgi:hypothetical protein